MLVRQDYNKLNDNHHHTEPDLDPAPDPSLPDDKALVALSSDVTKTVKGIAKLLQVHITVASKGPGTKGPAESKREDS